MKKTELEIMQEMAKKAISECEDLELLDLIYKLIVTSKSE